MPAPHPLWVAVTLVGCFCSSAPAGSRTDPLYVWLPDAMAGPTPVSALIHAATMVTAGVYMLARSSALYWHAPSAMFIVAVVGCATAIFAATMGLVQNDIKKVLAYSTVSQLGFMFLGAGVEPSSRRSFIETHAFFKACLFPDRDRSSMHWEGSRTSAGWGGSRVPPCDYDLPARTIAIAGIHSLPASFPRTRSVPASPGARALALWAVGFVARSARFLYVPPGRDDVRGTFRGTHEQEHHLHESPRSMTVPLIVLAALSCIGGFVGIPKFMTFGADLNILEHWLAPTVGYHGAPIEEIHRVQAALAAGLPARPDTNGPLTTAETRGQGREGLSAAERTSPHAKSLDLASGRTVPLRTPRTLTPRTQRTPPLRTSLRKDVKAFGTWRPGSS